MAVCTNHATNLHGTRNLHIPAPILKSELHRISIPFVLLNWFDCSFDQSGATLPGSTYFQPAGYAPNLPIANHAHVHNHENWSISSGAAAPCQCIECFASQQGSFGPHTTTGYSVDSTSHRHPVQTTVSPLNAIKTDGKEDDAFLLGSESREAIHSSPQSMFPSVDGNAMLYPNSPFNPTPSQSQYQSAYAYGPDRSYYHPALSPCDHYAQDIKVSKSGSIFEQNAAGPIKPNHSTVCDHSPYAPTSNPYLDSLNYLNSPDNWYHNDSDLEFLVAYLSTARDFQSMATPVSGFTNDWPQPLLSGIWSNHPELEDSIAMPMVRLRPIAYSTSPIQFGMTGWEGGNMPARVAPPTNLLTGKVCVVILTLLARPAEMTARLVRKLKVANGLILIRYERYRRILGRLYDLYVYPRFLSVSLDRSHLSDGAVQLLKLLYNSRIVVSMDSTPLTGNAITSKDE